MRRGLPILIAAGLALLVLGAPVFGQSTGGGKTKVASFTVTIITNVKGASILVDGARIKGNSVSLAPGIHSFRVTTSGYADFIQDVNVSSTMTLTAILQPLEFTLTVNPDVPNAEIFIDGARIKGNSVSVPAGMHTVRVSARGYEDYNATFSVTGPMVVSATLRSVLHQLTIRSNVPNAEIFIDGARIKGNTVSVTAGMHAVSVRADGYEDYNATFSVTGPLVISAELQQTGFPLTVTANVVGATVAFNNVVRGQTPYTEIVPAGTLTITVSAPGFLDYIANVAISRPTTINAKLQPGLATLNFVFPPQFQAPEREGLGLVRIMIDGKLMNPKKEVSGIQVSPGRHRISITSGGLAVELGDFDFSAGMVYSIELFMELRVKASAAAQ
jgi:hypothetical protein